MKRLIRSILTVLTNQRIHLVALISVSMVACTSQTRNGFYDDTYSDGVQETRGGLPISPSDILAHCNIFNSSSSDGDIDGAVTTVNYSDSIIHLNFTALPTDFDQKDAVLKFQKVSVTGAFTGAPEDMDILIENPNVGSLRGPFSELSKDTLTDNLFGLDLRSTQIVLQGLPSNYAVLRILLEESDGTPIAQKDILLPEFTVNPNKFVSKAPAALHHIHPLEAYVGTNYDDARYASFLNLNHSYCL